MVPTLSAGEVSVSVSPAYAVGDFGQPDDTRIYYLPLQLRYGRGPWSVAATFSYLSVRGPVVLTAGGVSGGAVSTESRSGAGDTWLEASHRFAGNAAVPDAVPYVKTKLATADTDKGLGSGEHDYEAGLGLEWILRGGWFPFVSAGYRRIGEPPGVRTRDIAVYEAGLSVHVRGDHYATFMFVGNQSALAATARAADLLLAWNYARKAGSGVQAYVDIGLSDGSPDYGIGVSVDWRF